MAILGKDSFGRINPTIGKPINSGNELVEEQVDKPIEDIVNVEQLTQIKEQPSSLGTAPLEYFDRMRGLKNITREPIGNLVQSDAKAFENNSNN